MAILDPGVVDAVGAAITGIEASTVVDEVGVADHSPTVTVYVVDGDRVLLVIVVLGVATTTNVALVVEDTECDVPISNMVSKSESMLCVSSHTS